MTKPPKASSAATRSQRTLNMRVENMPALDNMPTPGDGQSLKNMRTPGNMRTPENMASVAPASSGMQVPLDPLDAGRPFPMLMGGTYPIEWWAPEWVTQLVLAEFATTKWQSVKIPDRPNSPDFLDAQVHDLMEKRSLRAERLADIIAQDIGFNNLFEHLLMANAGRRPGTTILIHVAMGIGSLVSMHWKDQYSQARPSQIYPALLPVIQVPSHPSYPSGHALQSYLAVHLVTGALKDICGPAIEPPLTALASQIATNREIAGVHFAADSAASRHLASKLAPRILALKRLKPIIARARLEWGGVEVGAHPKPVQP